MFSKSHSKRADNHEEPSLLVRIGGPAALQAAVETFYEKLIADESLAKFFDGVNIDNLKIHQHRFLSLALTGTPPEFDVPTVIKVTHKRLFKMGLNETHFDSVVGHLMDALKDLQVKDEHIEEIISILAPLRTIFKNAGKRSLLDRIGGSAALEAAIDIFYEKMLADSTLTKILHGGEYGRLEGTPTRLFHICLHGNASRCGCTECYHLEASAAVSHGLGRNSF